MAARGPRRWAHYSRLVIREGAKRVWRGFGVVSTVVGATVVGVISAFFTDAVVGATITVATILIIGMLGSYQVWSHTDSAFEKAQEQLATRPSERRSALGAFLGRGDVGLKAAHLAALATEHGVLKTEDGEMVTMPHADTVWEYVGKWKRDVAEYLESAYGKAERNLFYSDVGIPADLGPIGFDDERNSQDLWTGSPR